jgi:hypothetical protein
MVSCTKLSRDTANPKQSGGNFSLLADGGPLLRRLHLRLPRRDHVRKLRACTHKSSNRVRFRANRTLS